jgi:hypothetical protein
MTGAAFVTSGSQFPVLDGILAVSLVIHSHIGVSPICHLIVRLPLTDDTLFFFTPSHSISADFARKSGMFRVTSSTPA